MYAWNTSNLLLYIYVIQKSDGFLWILANFNLNRWEDIIIACIFHAYILWNWNHILKHIWKLGKSISNIFWKKFASNYENHEKRNWSLYQVWSKAITVFTPPPPYIYKQFWIVLVEGGCGWYRFREVLRRTGQVQRINVREHGLGAIRLWQHHYVTGIHRGVGRHRYSHLKLKQYKNTFLHR